MDNQTISIDPSGTGTTSIFHCNKFYNFTNKYWIEHFTFIKMFIQDNNINKIYLENVKMIYNSTKDSLSLIKLLGALELSFKNHQFELLEITSDQTKRIAQWFKKIKYIDEDIKNKNKISKNILEQYDFCKKTELEYKYMKGWFFQGKKITEHNRDAVLIYWIGKERENEKE